MLQRLLGASVVLGITNWTKCEKTAIISIQLSQKGLKKETGDFPFFCFLEKIAKFGVVTE